MQILPAGPELLELMPSAKPNLLNSDTPKADGILFNINELANKYKSKQLK